MTTRKLSGKPQGGTVAEATDRDVTLYVRTGGADTNDGLTVGNALLTIQAAIDKIPKYVEHDIVVDIGPGNFDGFSVAGFTVPRLMGTLTIKGDLGNPTIVGNVTGTATSGTERVLIDAGGGWAVNELRGMYMTIAGETRLIRENTGTGVNFAGAFSASVSGKAYEVFERDTIINTASPDNNDCQIWITGNNAGREESLLLQDLEADGNIYAIFHQYGQGGQYDRVAGVNATGANILVQSVGGEVKIDNCWSDGNGGAATYGIAVVENGGQVRMTGCGDFESDYGFYLFGNGALTQTSDLYSHASQLCGIVIGNYAEVYAEHLLGEDSLGVGIMLINNLIAQIDTLTASNNTGTGFINRATPCTLLGDVNCNNNGGWGIGLSGNSAPANVHLMKATLDMDTATAIIATNTSGGIFADLHCVVILDDTTGINTGSYGVELTAGSLVLITSNTTITGSNDDCTIDEGSHDLDWAVDFPVNGDSIVNLTNLCRVERRD